MSGDAPQVRVLPDVVINQIAAGEVVERPASVVKELVENALDAGATRIRVEVLGGGLDWLSVEDDGHGMTAENARLALTRHATSKLRSAGDLTAIGTLGFRGEALPSIASVSRFSLRTATEGAARGIELSVAGGDPPTVAEVAPVRGTKVEVADLFFNTPARRKFLKRPTTELSHVTDVVVRLALAHPSAAFKLMAQGRSVIDAPKQGLGPEAALHRLGRLLGKTTAESLVALEDDGLHRAVAVRGFFGAPPLSERGPRGQFTFVNGRFVRDRTIASALADAYQGHLPKGRQPVVVLHLEVAPSEIDVNVHPQKTEVRFSRSGEVFRSVQSVLRRGLNRLGVRPTRPETDPEARRRAWTVAEERRPVDPGLARSQRYPTHGERLLDAFSEGPKNLSRWTTPGGSSFRDALSERSLPAEGPSAPVGPGAVAPDLASPPPPPEGRTSANQAGGDEADPPFSPPAPAAREVGSAGAQADLPIPDVDLVDARRVGVVLGRFLVLEAEQAMWLLDLAAAAARVARSSEADARPNLVCQPLLMPQELHLDPVRLETLAHWAPSLREGGLEIRVEEGRVLILGGPAEAGSDADWAALLDVALEAAEGEGSVADAVARSLRGADGRRPSPGWQVPADPQAIDALLAQLMEAPVRELGLDGQPLVIALGPRQLAHLFGRTP